MPPKDLHQVVSAQSRLIQKHEQALKQLLEVVRRSTDAPKWVEEMSGRRTPHMGIAELTIVADSTSRVSDTVEISEDGPFIMLGIAGYFRKTSGAYQGWWGPINAYDARIAAVTQGVGSAFLYDQPNLISGTVEITDQGSGRLMQDNAVASALWSPQAGGVYTLPTGYHVPRSSVILCQFTPNPSVPYSGVVQIVLLGYKIVQGAPFYP